MSESFRQQIAEHPEVVAKFRDFVDAAISVGVVVGADDLLALLPLPFSGLAGLVLAPAERALAAWLQRLIDVQLQRLIQAVPNTVPGSGLAGLTEISETPNTREVGDAR